jgi:hypothetical protein
MSLRGVSSLRLAVAVGVAVAVVAPNALAGTSQVPSADATHPHVTPRVGGRRRTFELSFTVAQVPGHSGLEYTYYRAVVSPPARARASCSPTQPALVTTGSFREVKTIALRPPTHGWCGGQYDVTVYLQRTSTCGPPLEAQPRLVPCPVSAREVEPAFPVGDVNTGETHFTVR